MNREKYIDALCRLGELINAWLLFNEEGRGKPYDAKLFADFDCAVQAAVEENEWFTEEGVKESLAAISSEMLDRNKLETWLRAYRYVDRSDSAKPIGVIAAGNIPLVCFHDIICVLLSGYSLLLKPSSKDKVLVEKVVELLIYFEPELGDRIRLTGTIDKSDIAGLIATGSDNTARYIGYEYAGIPIISRKNRTSIAVLTGGETEQELRLLSNDIFSYFGMGCRNVSKLYVPNDYDFTLFLEATKTWRERLERQPKYIGSFRHEYAISQSLGEQHINGGFFLLRANKMFNSPLSAIYYDFFSNLESVKNHLIQNADALQCVASVDGSVGNVRFGQTQKPTLSDYADAIDTIQWITNNIKIE